MDKTFIGYEIHWDEIADEIESLFCDGPLASLIRDHIAASSSCTIAIVFTEEQAVLVEQAIAELCLDAQVEVVE